MAPRWMAASASGSGGATAPLPAEHAASERVKASGNRLRHINIGALDGAWFRAIRGAGSKAGGVPAGDQAFPIPWKRHRAGG